MLVTGANSGIGKEVARQLALTGRYEKIILACRDEGKAEVAKTALEAATKMRLFNLLKLDLSDSASVRASVARLGEPLEDLVLNAGGFGGREPFRQTRDGVAEIAASNVLGNAVLLNELMNRGLLKRAVVLAGSEAARGVKKIRIKRPALKSSSVQEFIEICDGSYFREKKADIMSDYGVVKLVAALWLASVARRHPELRLVTMSPGSTSGTSVMNFVPAPVRFLSEKVLMPHVMPLLGLAHGVDAGARRLIDALLDERYKSGVFYASEEPAVIGPVVDQATIFPLFADEAAQDNAGIAIDGFVRHSAAGHARAVPRTALGPDGQTSVL